MSPDSTTCLSVSQLTLVVSSSLQALSCWCVGIRQERTSRSSGPTLSVFSLTDSIGSRKSKSTLFLKYLTISCRSFKQLHTLQILVSLAIYLQVKKRTRCTVLKVCILNLVYLYLPTALVHPGCPLPSLHVRNCLFVQ